MPMTKEKVWEAFCAKNPAFAQGDAIISLKARGLRKLFEETWRKAHEEGVMNGRALEKVCREQQRKTDNPFEAFFGR